MLARGSIRQCQNNEERDAELLSGRLQITIEILAMLHLTGES